MGKFAVVAAGLILISQLGAIAALGDEREGTPSQGSTGPLEGTRSRAVMVVNAVEDSLLRNLLREVVAANPHLEFATAEIRLNEKLALTVALFDDPIIDWSLFVSSPETRTGPQIGNISVMQTLPRRGTRALERRVAAAKSLGSRYRREMTALQLITRARELYYELLFVDHQQKILMHKQEHLDQHEELARARYSTGVGRGQDVLKLHAEISEVENQLLLLKARESSLSTRVNQLRRRRGSVRVERKPLAVGMLGVDEPSDRPIEGSLEIDPSQADQWLQVARLCRPELQVVDASIEAATASVELAEKAEQLELSLGLGYTVVGDRDDRAGQLFPPEDNGDDIVAFLGRVQLPVRRRQSAARIAATEQQRVVAVTDREVVEAAIQAEVEELLASIPLAWRRLRVAEDLLLVQSQESLASARASYVVGRSSVLDLLHAEHVLFEAHSAIVRARADYEIDLARLEGSLGTSLSRVTAADFNVAQECAS